MSPELPVILVTVTGRDTPGITSGLAAVLDEHQARLLDIGQSVIPPVLSLSLLFEIQASAREELLRSLQAFCVQMDLKLVFRTLTATELAEHPRFSPRASRFAVTLIAGQVPARALHRVAETLARHRFNIDEIQRLSEGHFGCVELLVSNLNPVDLAELKRELLALSREVGVDIAFQSEGLYRRAKRMIVFDLDSTLIQSEGIDELARELGRHDEVAAVTHAAMQGGMDYDESLRLRVEKLRGLTEAQIDAVYSRIELTPGAEELIRALKALGYRTALISGGFGCLAERIRSRLGIDRAFANELEMSQGRATGQVQLPIVNAHRKAELLEELARAEGIPLDQVIAVGDGANDLLMLEKAGLGIAFKAKPVLRQSADCALEQSSLSSILYLLGLSGRELQELLP